MKFSVIYSFDIAVSDSVAGYQPPNHARLWDLTEREDSGGDYHYVGLGKHRKYVAMLDREDFDEFVEHCDLKARRIETMGSLGAPGLGFGCSPAISFEGFDNDSRQSAYVTPVPTGAIEGRFSDRQATEEKWYKVKNAVLAVYGDEL